MSRWLPWVLSVAAPLLLIVSWRFVPYPGTLLAAGAIIGAYIGYILYEHTAARPQLSAVVIVEQLAVAVLLLVLFATAL